MTHIGQEETNEDERRNRRSQDSRNLLLRHLLRRGVSFVKDFIGVVEGGVVCVP